MEVLLRQRFLLHSAVVCCDKYSDDHNETHDCGGQNNASFLFHQQDFHFFEFILEATPSAVLLISANEYDKLPAHHPI
ncbi:MAG: hypothetical protein P9M15_03170, partial [Candidatus Electryoneaceae bacterium]|nr:hypothetical protein [Candidatus Electryoneaceae bacterium]